MKKTALLPKTELATKADVQAVIHAAQRFSYDQLVSMRWKRNKSAQMVLHQLALSIASLHDGRYQDALLHYGHGISSVENGAVASARGGAFRAYNLIVRASLEDLLARVRVPSKLRTSSKHH